jgi:hypothetical protein
MRAGVHRRLLFRLRSREYDHPDHECHFDLARFRDDCLTELGLTGPLGARAWASSWRLSEGNPERALSFLLEVAHILGDE